MTKHRRPGLNTKKWYRLKAFVKKRANYQCEMCGKPGYLEIDHIIRVEDDPSREFDPSNLQALCREHHINKTRMENMNLDDKTLEWHNYLETFGVNNHA